MLETFSKIVKKISNFFLPKLKKNLGTYQTILGESFFCLEKKCFKNLVGFFAEMPLSANLFQLESSIQEHAGSRGAARVGGAGWQIPPQEKRLKKKISNKDKKKFS